MTEQSALRVGTQCTAVLAVAKRFIPAGAGNTRTPPAKATSATGHPRRGGEHFLYTTGITKPNGSSPRGRGTLYFALVAQVINRVIPAGAGNTGIDVSVPSQASGHPRGGGKHAIQRGFGSLGVGSSPRGRGTRSPRARGKRRQRVIPAGAGNTRHMSALLVVNPGHPRGGGEHPSAPKLAGAIIGSSPRGRGTPSRPPRPAAPRRVIPAGAGNTWFLIRRPWLEPGHPRGGGEHAILVYRLDGICGSSPRGRGTQ